VWVCWLDWPGSVSSLVAWSMYLDFMSNCTSHSYQNPASQTSRRGAEGGTTASYSWGLGFDCQSGSCLSWLGILCFSEVPPDKCWDSTFWKATTPSKSFSNSSLTANTTIRCSMSSAAEKAWLWLASGEKGRVLVVLTAYLPSTALINVCYCRWKYVQNFHYSLSSKK
jgi:hypothetical protein